MVNGGAWVLASIADLSLIHGPIRVAVLAAGGSSLLVLVMIRRVSWWVRRVPVAVACGAVLTGCSAWFVDDVWRPFPDMLPAVVLLWVGLTGFALALAVMRPVSWPRRLAATLLASVVALCGVAQVNQHFGSYPTFRAALNLKLAHQVAFNPAPQAVSTLVVAQPGKTLTESWHAPANMPTTGVVTTAKIPNTVSGFAARDAWIYEPPAYLSVPKAQLPVLILLSGQPGSPRDWFDGGDLEGIMDRFAATHSGLAPLVVIPDQLGSQLAEPICVDSKMGNAYTYLSVDVPSWIRSTFDVDRDVHHWAVGGYSSGGTCSLQLAVNDPAQFPNFIDLSGEDAPTVGTKTQTVNEIFGGDAAAFARVNPLDILAQTKFAGSAGVITAGRDDSKYLPEAQRVLRATQQAGMNMSYYQFSGDHSWAVWGAGFEQSLPWFATRSGLTS